MMKKKKQQEEFEKKVQNVLYRIHQERIESPNSTVMARLMASNSSTGNMTVKIIVRLNDASFYCRGIKLWYSAGNEEFKSAMMDKLDDMNYAFVLANIPPDTTVLYFIEMLDRGGIWLKRYYDEKDQTPFEFSTSRDGIQEISNWNDPDLIKCAVCDYMCRQEWDVCPGCKTPLHDKLMTQEIFQDDQTKKEEERAKETDPDILSWKSVESVDILPECPSCGYAYQPDWNKCPICNYDLKKIQIEEESKVLNKESDKNRKNIDIL